MAYYTDLALEDAIQANNHGGHRDPVAFEGLVSPGWLGMRSRQPGICIAPLIALV